MPPTPPDDDDDPDFSGPHDPLTFGNLDGWNGPSETYVLPPPTVEDRLKQALNYLSDEDANLCMKFPEQHRQVEDFLRTLAKDKTPCDSGLYRQVRAMLDIHRDRMDKLHDPVPDHVDTTLLIPWSARLPSGHPEAKAAAHETFRRDDHAPFTLDRKHDQADFVRSLRSKDKDGETIRKAERIAYSQAMQSRKYVVEEVDGTSFEKRAKARGRRRAAVQNALNMFAGNEEQQFEGGWLHRVVSLPQPPISGPEEPQMYVGAPQGERQSDANAYEWTNKNITFQKTQEQLKTLIENNHERAGTHISAAVTRFPKPVNKPSVIAARRLGRLTRLVDLAFEVLLRLGIHDFEKAKEDTKPPASPEARILSVAATEGGFDPAADAVQEVPTSNKMHLLELYIKFGGQLLHPVSHDDGVEVRPLTDQELRDLRRCTVERLCNPDEKTSNLMQRLGGELFRRLEDVQGIHSSEYHERANDGHMEALANLRTSLAAKSAKAVNSKLFPSLQELAQSMSASRALPSVELATKLLTDRSLLENHLAFPDSKVDHDDMWAFSTKLPDASRTRNFFSMERWLPGPRHVPNTQAQSTGLPANLLPARSLGHKNVDVTTTGEKRKATSQTEGAPQSKRSQYAADYKSSSPDDPGSPPRSASEEIGFDAIKEDVGEVIPKPGKGVLMPPEIKSFRLKRDARVLEDARDPLEKFIPGPVRFPFAETGTLAAAMNMQIDFHLGHCKRFPPCKQASVTYG